MTTTQVVPAGHAAPVAQSERIDSLDVLRGFALLGILLMNIQMFGIPFAAYFNPTAYGDFTGANYWVWFAGRMFADQKFMTIFSMLFGAGVIVFTARAQERGDSPAALHYRRAFWLLVIGLAHAYLLWAGDILVSYALCAMLVYPARKLSPKALIITGLLVVSVASALMLMAAVSMPMWPPEDVAELRAGVHPPAEEIAKEIAAYRGSWGEQQPYRAKTAMEMHFMVFWLWALWRAGGLMLIGMAFYKWGIFSAVKSTAFYARMVIAGLLWGVPIIFLGIRANQSAQWEPTFIKFGGEQFNYWGSLGVSAAYVGLLMLFCKSPGGGWLKRSLRAVGQMAFTNYLMHSIICTAIFYGHGFGLFGQLSRVQMFGVVVGVWIAQMIYSPLWLARFQYGPFEWLWRSLTYWKMQPMVGVPTTRRF